MKRFLIFLFLSLFSLLYAAEYEEIMRSALSDSPSAEQAEIHHESGLISLLEAELDDEYDFSAEIAVSPLDDGIRRLNVDSLSFSLVTPDDDTTISASVPFAFAYDMSGGFLVPSASFRHVFDWGHDDETLKDLQREVLGMSVSREYQEDMLSIKRSVISILSELLSNEKAAKEAEEALRDAVKEKEDALTLGIVTKDSLSYLELELGEQRAEDSLAILQKEHEALVIRYQTLTGLEWDGLEVIPEPSFPDILSCTASSAVKEADIQAEIAREEVLVAESLQNPEHLVTGVNAGGYIGIGEGIRSEENPLSLEGVIGWEGKNWTLTVSGGGVWDSFFSFSPQLTLSAGFQSGSGKSDELEMRSLRNTARMREVEASDQRRSFNENVQDLWGRILRWEREKGELEATLRYQEALSGMQELKYERGMITKEELDESRNELSSLAIDYDIKKLEGLALEAEAESLIL